jgi:hypothetical protein
MYRPGQWLGPRQSYSKRLLKNNSPPVTPVIEACPQVDAGSRSRLPVAFEE